MLQLAKTLAKICILQKALQREMQHFADTNDVATICNPPLGEVPIGLKFVLYCIQISDISQNNLWSCLTWRLCIYSWQEWQPFK